ncbi:MAG: class I SAM-dependent methyltransferase [Candidatus Marinimicrobia bacterium]|nr:class I SAM-dependent methyltransferase [Candidatus Neomarinimicrobiota bacterium]
MTKFYPDSGVELQGFTAKFYDKVMNIMTFGGYSIFIKNAIKSVKLNPDDNILDFGAGTGRNALLMDKQLSDKGEILGLEISDLMISQFKKKTENHPNINAINKRIDQPFQLEKKYDKIFISFVFHGFPFEIQKNIIKNAFNNLKNDGEFVILDFGHFDTEKTPFYFRIPFKAIECKYAFEYTKRDWEKILSEYGFKNFEKKLFLGKYIRLLKAKK